MQKYSYYVKEEDKKCLDVYINISDEQQTIILPCFNWHKKKIYIC